MTKHTKEPWPGPYQIHRDSQWIYYDEDGLEDRHKATAEFAVSAMNACAGMADPEKEIRELREAAAECFNWIDASYEIGDLTLDEFKLKQQLADLLGVDAGASIGVRIEDEDGVEEYEVPVDYKETKG